MMGGKVVDPAGMGIGNATVTLRNTSLSTKTGADGTFLISGDASSILLAGRGIRSTANAAMPFGKAPFNAQGRRLLRTAHTAAGRIFSSAREPEAARQGKSKPGTLSKEAANGLYVLNVSAPGFIARDWVVNSPNVNGLQAELPSLAAGAQFGSASAFFIRDTLVVSTGKIMRAWKWTGKGFATVSLVNLTTGTQWAQRASAHACDWSFKGLIGESSPAVNMGVTMHAAAGIPLQSDHLEITAEVAYPAANLSIRYVVWAYPDAPGLRTQVFAKSLNPLPTNSGGEDRIESLPVGLNPLGNSRIRAVGHRYASPAKNIPGIDLVVEDTSSVPRGGKSYDSSNILWIERPGEGLGLVKEANKTMDNDGLGTGSFLLDSIGLASTGWGLGAAEILNDRYRPAWANWCLAYTGGQDARELAMKVFDRLRFPVDTLRDIYIMENTWGSGLKTVSSQESNVLQDLDACKDLGIDVLQIDAGGSITAPVKSLAQADGVVLGVWNSWNSTASSLTGRFDRGNRYFKMDLMQLQGYGDLEAVVGAADSLARYSGYAARQNWDITEDMNRVGFFFAREYGNLFLSNRYVSNDPAGGKAGYDPAIMLRDAWQISRYINLNKILIPIQNVDRYDYPVADKYDHAYCTAIGLMGSPLFFQQTSLLSTSARDQIRPLLAIYKQNRAALFRQYVFPIGAKPDGSSWSGFQSYERGSAEQGYLMIFREAGNLESVKNLKLRFLGGKTLSIEDLQSKVQRTVVVSADGSVPFNLAKAKSFLFLKYRVQP